MFVLMQYKTVAALTNVRADRVDALVLAAAVVLAALILVCEGHTHTHTRNTSLNVEAVCVCGGEGGVAKEGTGASEKERK